MNKVDDVPVLVGVVLAIVDEVGSPEPTTSTVVPCLYLLPSRVAGWNVAKATAALAEWRREQARGAAPLAPHPSSLGTTRPSDGAVVDYLQPVLGIPEAPWRGTLKILAEVMPKSSSEVPSPRELATLWQLHPWAFTLPGAHLQQFHEHLRDPLPHPPSSIPPLDAAFAYACRETKGRGPFRGTGTRLSQSHLTRFGDLFDALLAVHSPVPRPRSAAHQDVRDFVAAVQLRSVRRSLSGPQLAAHGTALKRQWDEARRRRAARVIRPVLVPDLSARAAAPIRPKALDEVLLRWLRSPRAGKLMYVAGGGIAKFALPDLESGLGVFLERCRRPFVRLAVDYAFVGPADTWDDETRARYEELLPHDPTLEQDEQLERRRAEPPPPATTFHPQTGTWHTHERADVSYIHTSRWAFGRTRDDLWDETPHADHAYPTADHTIP